MFWHRKNDFENQIFATFDPAYSRHSRLKEKCFVGSILLVKNLHLVGCATVCSKSEATLMPSCGEEQKKLQQGSGVNFKIFLA